MKIFLFLIPVLVWFILNFVSFCSSVSTKLALEGWIFGLSILAFLGVFLTIGKLLESFKIRY
jgi:hypothetical protein